MPRVSGRPEPYRRHQQRGRRESPTRRDDLSALPYCWASHDRRRTAHAAIYQQVAVNPDGSSVRDEVGDDTWTS